MKIEKIGGRLYVTDAPYALKDRLKAAGCHWDSERRAPCAACRNSRPARPVSCENDG